MGKTARSSSVESHFRSFDKIRIAIEVVVSELFDEQFKKLSEELAFTKELFDQVILEDHYHLFIVDGILAEIAAVRTGDSNAAKFAFHTKQDLRCMSTFNNAQASICILEGHVQGVLSPCHEVGEVLPLF